MIGMVLATDFSLHQQKVNDFRLVLSSPPPPTASPPPPRPPSPQAAGRGSAAAERSTTRGNVPRVSSVVIPTDPHAVRSRHEAEELGMAVFSSSSTTWPHYARSQPCTMYHAPCAMYPVPFTICHVPGTLHPERYLVSCTLHPSPGPMYHVPCTMYHVPCTMYHALRVQGTH